MFADDGDNNDDDDDDETNKEREDGRKGRMGKMRKERRNDDDDDDTKGHRTLEGTSNVMATMPTTVEAAKTTFMKKHGDELGGEMVTRR